MWYFFTLLKHKIEIYTSIEFFQYNTVKQRPKTVYFIGLCIKAVCDVLYFFFFIIQTNKTEAEVDIFRGVWKLWYLCNKVSNILMYYLNCFMQKQSK